MSLQLKKIKFIVFTFIVVFIQGYSQNAINLTKLLSDVREASYYDSTDVFGAGNTVLKACTPEEAEKIKAEVYIYYGNYFFYTRNLERAKYWFNTALEQAERINSSHFIILAKIRLAYLRSESEDFRKIEKEMVLLSKEAAENNDFENIAEIINMRAIFHEQHGDPKTTANLYLEGLNLAKNHHLEYYEATFYNNFGLLKFSLNAFDQAMVDFSSAIKIAKKISNKRLLSHAKLNLSLVLIGQKNYKEAHELFNEVIQYAHANNHPLELSSAYANLGNAYMLNKNPNTGLLYIDSAIKVLEKYQFKSELTQAYIGKSNVLLELNNFNEAEKTLQCALELMRKYKLNEEIENYYLLYYEIYYKRKDYKKALEYHLLYTQAKDEKLQKLSAKALEELQLKYNVQAKEIELEKEKTRTVLLEKSHQEEVYIRYSMIAALFVIITLLIIYFYWRYYREIRKQQAQFSRQLITNTEDERSRIAKDLHDDIGQSLSILKSKFTNKNQFENTEIISKEIERVIDQTRQISRNLFPSYLEKIGLKRAIAGLAENVQNTYHIECSYDVCDDSEKIRTEISTHIFRIIQECLNNTIKHSKATALKISINNIDDDEFILLYVDNGNWKNSNLKEPGVGLLSIKERAKMLNAQISIDENEIKGFKLALKFKNVI